MIEGPRSTVVWFSPYEGLYKHRAALYGLSARSTRDGGSDDNGQL